MGSPLQETVDNYLFRRKDLMAILFSRLIAFVECCVAVPANRIDSKTMTLEQGIRYLSREEKMRHITGRPKPFLRVLSSPLHGLVENRAVGRARASITGVYQPLSCRSNNAKSAEGTQRARRVFADFASEFFATFALKTLGGLDACERNFRFGHERLSDLRTRRECS